MNDRLKQIRLLKGLTQSELAEAIGVKQGTIAGYESGRREPQDVTIKAIANAFGIREEWIRTGEGQMTAGDDPSIDQIAQQVQMTETERALIVNFLKLPKETRNQIIDGMQDALIRNNKEPMPNTVRYPEETNKTEEVMDLAAFEGDGEDDEEFKKAFQREAERMLNE